jgi:hypothetical protein
MSKHDKAKIEKAERNEINAKRFQSRSKKSRMGQYKNWCRMPGHPASCSCTLPSREEVIQAGRRR